jgi:hypothetical protein
MVMSHPQDLACPLLNKNQKHTASQTLPLEGEGWGGGGEENKK